MLKHEPNSNSIIIPISDIIDGDASVSGYNSDDGWSRIRVEFDKDSTLSNLNYLSSLVIPTSDELKEKIVPLLEELKDTTNNMDIYLRTKEVLNWIKN